MDQNSFITTSKASILLSVSRQRIHQIIKELSIEPIVLNSNLHAISKVDFEKMAKNQKPSGRPNKKEK